MLANTWVSQFGWCVVADRVVELPDGFGLPRLTVANTNGDNPVATSAYQNVLDAPDGILLIRFSDATTTLLAGSSETIRTRFDTLKVTYATRNTSGAAEFAAYLAVMRKLAKLSDAR